MEILPQICSPDVDKLQEFYHLPLYMETQAKSNTAFPLIGFRASSHFNSGSLISLDEIDMKGSDLVRVAFSNLKEVKIIWNEMESESCSYLKAEHAFAVEKILDKDFIKEATQLLDSKSLYISIPTRGIILAIGEKDYKTNSNHFEQQIWNYFGDASKESVSDLIYKIEEGQIISYSSLSKSIRITDIIKECFPTNFYHQKATIKLINGDIYVKSLIGAPDIKILLEGCFQIIIQALQENENEISFTGLLEFQTIPSRIIKTRENVSALNEFLNKLPKSEILNKWSIRINKPIEVSFIFGEDFKVGAMERKHTITLGLEK